MEIPDHGCTTNYHVTIPRRTERAQAPLQASLDRGDGLPGSGQSPRHGRPCAGRLQNVGGDPRPPPDQLLEGAARLSADGQPVGKLMVGLLDEGIERVKMRLAMMRLARRRAAWAVDTVREATEATAMSRAGVQ